MKQREEKAAKPPKIKKAPGFYKKKLNKNLLQKKYLKYLGQPGDKSFIQSCYAANGDDFAIRQNLTEAEVKRLKALKKAIKANRKSAVKFVPLAVAAALVAALVIFFTIFANPLLQKALETGLEAVFEARVNANRFRVSLLKFEIAMDSLTIADRDSPMKNLIQFNTLRLKLKPEAVLRGRVYIEEIRADHIRFGTDRTVSGALPDKPAKVKPPKEETAIPPLVNLQSFDPMALLEAEYDKLKTPKLYGDAKDAYDAAAAKWKGEQEAATARIAELKARSEPLLKINANDYKTLDAATIAQIRSTITEVNDMVNSVQAAQADVNRMVSGVQADINAARALEQSARNAFNTDFTHLRSYLDLGSGAAMEVLEPVVRSMLTDAAEEYLDYGARALEILEKVKAMQAMLPKSSPKPPKAAKFKGRDVIFPTRQYPRFFMGILATDVLTPQGWQWDFDLRAVSSAPDISNLPTTLALSLAETGDGVKRSGAFKGLADFRSSATERFNAELTAGGFPVDVSLAQAGIGGFSGGASFKLNASGNTGGGFTGGGDVSLVQAKLTNPSNTFAQAADEAIRQVKSVDLGIHYEHVVDGKDRFSLTTNFGDILKNALNRIVAQYRKQAEAALEKALREKFREFVDEKYVSSEDLDRVFSAVRGDKGAVDELKSGLDKKKAELENKVKSAADEAKDEAKQQAQGAGQQAVQDLLHGQTPQAPSLPSLPGLKKP